MDPVPAEIKNLYDAALNRHGIPATEHHYYIKWLRYYLDYCAKYHHEKSGRESLSLFIRKLKDKNQTDMQRKQAFHAVSIYCEIKDSANGKMAPLNIKEDDISTEKVELKNNLHFPVSPIPRFNFNLVISSKKSLIF